MHIHLVQPGDTLAHLALRYRVTPERVAACNALPSASCLLPGHALCIPSTTWLSPDRYATYHVQAGDTLRSVSDRWQVPVTWLSLCNQLSDSRLTPGEILLVPQTNDHVPGKRTLRLLSLGVATTRAIDTDVEGPSCTYHALPGLRVSAAGGLQFPPLHPRSPAPVGKTLLICSLDATPQVLPDVAKAILQSEQAQMLILERLAMQVRPAGADGVIFDWQVPHGDWQAAYLSFVKEAGRRLRPMGLIVGLALSGDDKWLHKRARLADTAPWLDHFFFDPLPERDRSLPVTAFEKAPAPLLGLEDARQRLLMASERLPLSQTWLVIHPLGLLTKRGHVPQPLSAQAALQLAYRLGAPLQRDASSGLAWFRVPGGAVQGEGGCSVWLEDLWSLTRKIDLLDQLKLQGLALWEQGAFFPEAWSYLAEQFEQDEELE